MWPRPPQGHHKVSLHPEQMNGLWKAVPPKSCEEHPMNMLVAMIPVFSAHTTCRKTQIHTVEAEHSPCWCCIAIDVHQRIRSCGCTPPHSALSPKILQSFTNQPLLMCLAHGCNGEIIFHFPSTSWTAIPVSWVAFFEIGWDGRMNVQKLSLLFRNFA